MENNATKTCKLCKMQIPAGARKCPHCLHWQSKFAITNPAIFMPLIMLFALFPSLGIVKMVYYMGDRGELLENHPGALEAIDYSYSFVPSTCSSSDHKDCKHSHKHVLVSGKIANKSDITWRKVTIEITLYNASGKIINTRQCGREGFVAPAHKTVAFSYYLERRTSERYADLKVRVIYASENDRY